MTVKLHVQLCHHGSHQHHCTAEYHARMHFHEEWWWYGKAQAAIPPRRIFCGKRSNRWQAKTVDLLSSLGPRGRSDWWMEEDPPCWPMLLKEFRHNGTYTPTLAPKVTILSVSAETKSASTVVYMRWCWQSREDKDVVVRASCHSSLPLLARLVDRGARHRCARDQLTHSVNLWYSSVGEYESQRYTAHRSRCTWRLLTWLRIEFHTSYHWYEKIIQSNELD